MIPLKDTIPTHHRPVTTKTLIYLNATVFVFALLLSETAIQKIYFQYGVIPRRLLSAQYALAFPGDAWITLFTSMFLHGGFLHILSNMWMLWIFGDNVEDRMGRLRFLGFYLTCGLAAMALHVLTNSGSTTPTIGASGAIAGVLGAYMRMYPHATVLTFIPIFFFIPIIPVPAMVFLGLWFVSQFFQGAMSLVSAGGEGGIAWWAHIGGFLAGMYLHPLFLSARRIAAIRAHGARSVWR